MANSSHQLDRRQWLAGLAATVSTVSTGSTLSTASSGLLWAQARFSPDWESLKQHKIPAWYDDAKLGIFIHWGLYSVPAWAETSGELGQVDMSKWFYHNAYSEWYLNSIRLKESTAYAHHAKTYGADYDYYRFADTFNKALPKWQPDSWASLIAGSGAKYVVLTTKHHDGFTLWPSRVKNPKRPDLPQVARDIVGELTNAVRAKGLRMGLYYSGGLDWTFESQPVASMADLMKTAPKTEEYAAYADAHWRELMDRYQPTILWNDITYPKKGKLAEIFADFYNRTPDGLVNNRFSAPHADITTPEYEKYDKITEKKWETCRGLGFSFGYNQTEGPQQVIAADKLIAMLVDITSKNGNLLLNIGPRPDGSISEIQIDRLQALGRWMQRNAEGIQGTRPWQTAAAESRQGQQIRFTQKGNALYAFALSRPTAQELTLPNLVAKPEMKVRLLGGGDVKWQQQGSNLQLQLPKALPGEHALGLRLTPQPALRPQ